MSKLAIFLCAVLFASAANASHWSDVVKSVQENVGHIIEGAIDKIKHITESVKIQAQKVVALLHKTTELVKKVENKVTEILKKFEDEIAQLKDEAKNANATDCTKMLTHLEYTGLAIIANMSHCVTDKYKTGMGYIEDIVRMPEHVLANLTQIKNEAFHCGDDVHNFKSAIAAIRCVNNARVKATLVTVKVIPEMRADLSKLSEWLITFEPSLAQCITESGLHTFYEESLTIVANARKCIRQKIHNGRDTVPEIGSNHHQE